MSLEKTEFFVVGAEGEGLDTENSTFKNVEELKHLGSILANIPIVREALRIR